jgi:ATP-dependent RNA helicase DDX3X
MLQVNTKRSADWLQDQLWEHCQIRAAPIHGDLSQYMREKALMQFRNGKVRVLIGTDVAARGLDVSNIAHVINFDLPTQIDDYVHRIGRTGRAGNAGHATSLFDTSGRKNGDLGIASDIRKTMREGGSEVPGWLDELLASRSQRGGGGSASSRGGRPQRGRRGSFHGQRRGR